MASRSCSSWCAELKASSRISVSFRSFSRSSERSSDIALSPLSPSSAVSMILERPSGILTYKHWQNSFNILFPPSVYLHRRGSGAWCFKGWSCIFICFNYFVSHLWGVGSWRVRRGDFLNVWVGFGAFLNAESLVKGAPQLLKTEKNSIKCSFSNHHATYRLKSKLERLTHAW